MGQLRKGIEYTFRVVFADGREETCLATSEEQAIRIAKRKRGTDQIPVMETHATTDDRPKARTR